MIRFTFCYITSKPVYQVAINDKIEEYFDLNWAISAFERSKRGMDTMRENARTIKRK